jgi:uncharacterized C2H2 Zn-finger protein
MCVSIYAQPLVFSLGTSPLQKLQPIMDRCPQCGQSWKLQGRQMRRGQESHQSHKRKRRGKGEGQRVGNKTKSAGNWVKQQ